MNWSHLCLGNTISLRCELMLICATESSTLKYKKVTAVMFTLIGKNCLHNYYIKILKISTALTLRENTTLTHLSLGKCGIDVDGVDQLSTCLRNKASLQHLVLNENKIGSHGLTNLGKLSYITESIKRCSKGQVH